MLRSIGGIVAAIIERTLTNALVPVCDKGVCSIRERACDYSAIVPKGNKRLLINAYPSEASKVNHELALIKQRAEQSLCESAPTQLKCGLLPAFIRERAHNVHTPKRRRHQRLPNFNGSPVKSKAKQCSFKDAICYAMKSFSGEK